MEPPDRGEQRSAPTLDGADHLAATEPCVNSKKLEAKYLQEIRSESANLLSVLFYYKGCCVK
jgi:hypothetical protein